MYAAHVCGAYLIDPHSPTFKASMIPFLFMTGTQVNHPISQTLTRDNEN